MRTQPSPPDEAILRSQELFRAVVSVLDRHIDADFEVLVVAALWCCSTWFSDQCEQFPIAHITSKESESGKSTLLELMSMLSRRPIVSSAVQPRALYPLLYGGPSLFLDMEPTGLGKEAEHIFESGYNRFSSAVLRQYRGEVYTFSTWGPKAIASKATLPAALESRSIPIRLHPRRTEVKKTRVTETTRRECEELQADLESWTKDRQEDFRNATPEPVPGLSDRANDNWHPLLAVSILLGQRCHFLARGLAWKLSSKANSPAVSCDDTDILERIRTAFDQENAEVIATSQLLEILNENPRFDGKPISPKELAGLLKPYGIHPRSTRLPCGGNLKAYHRSDFEVAFNHLPIQPTPNCDASQNVTSPSVG